jgi:transcriptional regulator with PAS, ATPase and Fis domain
MQVNQSQIRERFSQVEQCIDNAAQMCEMSSDVPERLRTCLNELEQESDHAIQVVEQQQNEEHIRQCVTKMEKIGDRAIQACSQADYVDQQVQNAVRQARKAISSLKQQLH